MTQENGRAEDVLELRKAAAQLREQGRLAEAASVLQRAVARKPDDRDAQAELGLTFALMGRPAEAEPCYRRALAIDPNDSFSWANLGGALMALNRPADAETCFREVLAREPGHAAALRNLGMLLKDMGRLDEAKAALLKASESDTALEVTLQAHLGLSPIARSPDDIERQRASYAAGLEALAAGTGALAYNGAKINLPWFYLAYHGRDDRALMRRTAEVLAQRMYAPPAAAAPLRSSGDRIRVVFCSEFLHDHTIGRLYRGLIRHLDRSRFEVVVAHGPYSRADAFRAALDGCADRAVILPRALDAQREAIRALSPDVLFFPDIGMSAQTWFLARSRLAPVQAVSWGHPDTTGLGSIDYFVSADGIEPQGAEAGYVEGLVRLPRLPCFYETPPPPPSLPRAALRLPETGVLYGCPQSLFKLHPDFDAVLARIAEGDPRGHLVLIESRNAAWTQVLRERWAASHPILLERVRFLPRLSHDGFMAHLAHIDVLLDPPHFGSGNTLYEAMALGTPIVTWPGEFMRGRIVAAAYAQMQVDQPPVARNLADYAELALALGRDAEARKHLKSELAAKARQGLYEDMAAVRAFEDFFTAAVDAAADGARLPAGWRNSKATVTA